MNWTWIFEGRACNAFNFSSILLGSSCATKTVSSQVARRSTASSLSWPCLELEVMSGARLSFHAAVSSVGNSRQVLTFHPTPSPAVIRSSVDWRRVAIVCLPWMGVGEPLCSMSSLSPRCFCHRLGGGCRDGQCRELVRLGKFETPSSCFAPCEKKSFSHVYYLYSIILFDRIRVIFHTYLNAFSCKLILRDGAAIN